MGRKQFEILVHLLESQNESLRQIDHLLKEILRKIEHEPPPPAQDITSFIITPVTESGDPAMPLLPIAPGNSPQFTATPVPAGAVPTTPPTWTSSDTTNAPITVDAAGLVATVAIPASATVGTSFTLTVSYTNADGTVATGSITETIVAVVHDITSFTIAQTV